MMHGLANPKPLHSTQKNCMKQKLCSHILLQWKIYRCYTAMTQQYKNVQSWNVTLRVDNELGGMWKKPSGRAFIRLFSHFPGRTKVKHKDVSQNTPSRCPQIRNTHLPETISVASKARFQPWGNWPQFCSLTVVFMHSMLNRKNAEKMCNACVLPIPLSVDITALPSYSMNTAALLQMGAGLQVLWITDQLAYI